MKDQNGAIEREVLIRPALPEDVPVVFDLGQTVFQNPQRYDWGFVPLVLRGLCDPDYGLLHVAEHSGRIIAFHCGTWCYPESSPVQCRMMWLYVAPAFRRRGVGTALIQRSIEEAEKRGKTHVCIGVFDDDVAAGPLVEGLGFTKVAGWGIYRRSVAKET